MSTISPQIKFLPNANRCQTGEGKKTDLPTLFNALINHQPLELDEEQLKQIMLEDLNLKISIIDERLQAVLQEALVYYMKIWPGWKRSDEFYRGEFTSKYWCGRFKNYLILKSYEVIKNAAQYTVGMNNEPSSKDAQVQANVNPLDKTIAPYTLWISGPPFVLNNILFEEFEGDILIKQRQLKPWSNLKIGEFLNWPYVSVTIKLLDLSFTRTNTHKFERYVTLCDDVVVLPETDHVKHITKTANAREHELVPYSYDFIGYYLHHFYLLVKNIPGMNENRVQELKAIFVHFLNDIKEVDVYGGTVCTKTSIGFNIGKSKYIRKNQIPQKPVVQNPIDYYEVLTPQVDFTLNYLYAEQDFNSTDAISFKNINKYRNCSSDMIENLKTVINNTCIMYDCTLCSTNFIGYDAYYNLTQHFVEKHSAEQNVKCYKCLEEFPLNILAGKRWSHACS